MELLTFVAEESDSNQRVDAFLAKKMDTSRSLVQKLLDAGNVGINGAAVNKSYKLKELDLVNVNIPDPVSVEIIAENIPIDILYEDDDIILVNKAKGMVVHPADGHVSGTLVNALLYHSGKSLSGINGVLRPGIVHRIDKDTSGVIVVAKNDRAHQRLSVQLAAHSINRVYNGIACGVIKDDKGVIDLPIGRCETDRKKMAVNKKNGKAAVTHYEVIERFQKHTLIEARLETGRTHQIRVHMAQLGYPLLGDEVYGYKKQTAKTQGQALHARVLGFVHPATGVYVEFEAPLPQYFNSLLENMRCKLR